MGGRYASYWNASLLDENYEKTRLCYVSSADLTNLIHVWFVKEIELSHVPRPHLSEFNSFEVSRNASKKNITRKTGKKAVFINTQTETFDLKCAEFLTPGIFRLKYW